MFRISIGEAYHDTRKSNHTDLLATSVAIRMLRSLALNLFNEPSLLFCWVQILIKRNH